MSTIQQSLIDQKQPAGGIGGGLDWALEVTKKVATIYDQIKTIGKSPEVVIEKPRTGLPEGTNVQNVDPKAADRGAETINKVQQIYDQVKGLFNIGFPQESPQPTSPVVHEIEPSSMPFGLSIGTMAIIGLLILLMVKK
jgi:hypothetical protein